MKKRRLIKMALGLTSIEGYQRLYGTPAHPALVKAVLDNVNAKFDLVLPAELIAPEAKRMSEGQRACDEGS